MRINVTERNKDFLKNLTRSATEMQGRKLRVGVPSDGKMGVIAHVHEYGCDIRVTPKMRAYLSAAKGIHLKASTTVIRIPERSFIRAGYDKHQLGWRRKVGALIRQNITSNGTIPVDTLLDMFGLELSGKIQEFARDLSSPPNSPATTMLKGSSNPLVDTGGLIGAIKHEID